MSNVNRNIYDVAIIGAGMSGLVCGCYLARAGMKVIIAEQHFKPGGYCTSFKRKGFTFDAAAHAFGGYRTGILGKVFRDLDIDRKFKTLRFDPSDIIITPDYKITLWANLEKTIEELQAAFPEERNIRIFFLFLFNPDPNSFSQIRSWTFKNLLDHYLHNDNLKAILSFPLFGNAGLPASKISAFLGAKIYKEFLLDGGYYPESGMQALPDAFAERFKEFGGELLLSCLIKKIRVNNSSVQGIVTKNGNYIPARYVISNCDARQTFIDLIGRDKISPDFLSELKKMDHSLSMYILYLGLDNYYHNLPAAGINRWILYHYDLDDAYRAAQKGDYKNIGGYMVRVSPDRKNVIAFINSPFKNVNYWKIHKEQLSDSFMKRIEIDALPDLSKHVVYKDAATPHTLQRYTLNYKGSAYGWAGTPSQLANSNFRKPSFIKNLYLTGHWTTLGLGIPGVIYVGYDTAMMLLRNKGFMNKI
jgi:phytoene dehydrogenase-like protein